MLHYNVIIGYFDGSGTLKVPKDRFYPKNNIFLEYKGKTPDEIPLKTFCMNIPTLFTGEISRYDVPMARIGWITNIIQHDRSLHLTYRLPSGITALPADLMAQALGLTNSFSGSGGIGDMQHSHWTIKAGDLFQTLCQAGLLENTQPSVFRTPTDSLQSNLVSVMMPFSSEFNAVYETISMACENSNLECKRADNIWDDSIIIQDIYSLIYRSKIVVCDFSGKNPNVFYEAGIAHSLGRAVIPIVQNQDDIPFDLSLHRYIPYLNNAEGLQKLVMDITPRLKTLMSKRT
jgi:hypothetical protein